MKMKRSTLQNVILALTGIGAAAVISMTILIGFWAVRRLTAGSTKIDHISANQEILGKIDEKTVKEILKPAGDLVTMKDAYVVQESYEKHRELFGFHVPLSTDETFLSFSCEIGIGFDLTDMDITVDNRRSTITLTLPKPQIVYNQIDMDSVYIKTVHNSWLINTADQELMDVMAAFQNSREQDYLEDGTVFRRAESEAERILAEYLEKSAVTQDYTVRFA